MQCPLGCIESPINGILEERRMPYLSTAVDLQNAQNCTSTAATAACKSMIMCYFDYEDFVIDPGERFLNQIRFKIAPLDASDTVFMYTSVPLSKICKNGIISKKRVLEALQALNLSDQFKTLIKLYHVQLKILLDV